MSSRQDKTLTLSYFAIQLGERFSDMRFDIQDFSFSLTLSISIPEDLAMKPSTEKTTVPEKTEVMQLATATRMASRWQFRRKWLYEESVITHPHAGPSEKITLKTVNATSNFCFLQPVSVSSPRTCVAASTQI